MNGIYTINGKQYTSDELIKYYEQLVSKYPIISIEDGLDQEDYTGWKKLTSRLGAKIQLVGDDLFVTNTNRLKAGIAGNYSNSILIKLNQIGTLSETIDCIEMAVTRLLQLFHTVLAKVKTLLLVIWQSV